MVHQMLKPILHIHLKGGAPQKIKNVLDSLDVNLKFQNIYVNLAYFFVKSTIVYSLHST